MNAAMEIRRFDLARLLDGNAERDREGPNSCRERTWLSPRGACAVYFNPGSDER